MISLILSKVSKNKAVAAFCSALLVSGCSTIVDSRQLVTGPSMGVVSFARIVTVLEARTEGSTSALYDSAAGNIASDATSRSRLRNWQAIPSIVSTLTGDIETRYAQTLCIYIVQTSDRRVTESLAQSVFNSFDDDDKRGYYNRATPDDDNYEEDPSFDEDGEEISTPSRKSRKPQKGKVPTAKELSEKFLQEFVSVVQNCNESLVPNMIVFLTLTGDAPTIHRLDPKLYHIFRSWESLRTDETG